MKQEKESSHKRFRRAGRGALAAIALIAAATPALGATSRGFEHGGYFTRFDPVVDEFNRNGKEFRIVGLCQSACTLFLSIKNACVEPQAVFQFHAGHDGKGNISTSATLHMINSYNPKLRNFVIANGYMESLSFSTISAREIIDTFGYRACGPRMMDVDNNDDDRDDNDGERRPGVSEKFAQPDGDTRTPRTTQSYKDTGR